jgi:hypothetical protein
LQQVARIVKRKAHPLRLQNRAPSFPVQRFKILARDFGGNIVRQFS